MSKLGVQNPITAGQVIGAYNASSVADTDWHSLTSNEFYDPITGDQLTDGLKFAFMGAVSSSTSAVSFLKLREAAGAGDGTGNTDGVIPMLGRYDVDVQALSGGAAVTSIAYKKAAAGDQFIIYCGFNQ
jgi:hypothetical protein